MLARIRRTVLTFAAVLGAYFAYALAVVPLIEPSVKLSAKKGAVPPPAVRIRKFDHLFPPGAWELAQPKVIETGQGTLLFDDYKLLPDDKQELTRLELTKCTVICSMHRASGPPDADGRPGKRPLILRAPDGATLQFDRPLNILRGEFGKLTSGQLVGDVTIDSPASATNANDALELVTKNVQITEQQVWTPHEVRFRYGPNQGQGRDLRIHLSATSHPGAFASGKSGGTVASLRSLELTKLDRMELWLHDAGLFGKPRGGSPAARNKDESASPVEVRCAGPIGFDFDRQRITLKDDVDLQRQHPSGAKDQLLCQWLEIHFTVGSVTTVDSRSTRPSPSVNEKLTPTKVIALGEPVVIRAASIGIGTRAQRVEYDCVLQRVWLQDRDKVLLNDRQRTVEAKAIQYSLAENGRLGDLSATGPGIVRGEIGRAGRRFNAAWQGTVELRRIDGEPVLSLQAGTDVTVFEVGTFRADRLDLYLLETTRVDDSTRVDVQLDRLHAVGNVVVDGTAIHAQVREAKIWFQQLAQGVPNPQRRVAPVGQPPGIESPANGSNPARRPKYQLTAHTVEALLILGEETVAERLIVRGALTLQEVAVAGLKPLTIRGDLFELQEGSSAHPRGALLGKPAEVAARGMTMHGDRFHVYPQDNWLEAIGAGDMTLPPQAATGSVVDRSANIDSRTPAHIEWQAKMTFDGLTATFEKAVAIRGSQASKDGTRTSIVAMGDIVRADLTHRVDFQDPRVDGPIDLAAFGFDGSGFLQTEIFDPAGERKLFEQMQVRELTVNRVTGEIRGQGPGWVRGIHRGQDVVAADPPPQSPLPSSAGLNFLRVDFQRDIAGNLLHRRLEFLNGTRTVFGPVKSWDDTLDQEGVPLPANAVNLTSDRLAVAQMGEGAEPDDVELEALGNTRVQGQSFAATCNRISYVRAKDQLILEGDGRNDAYIEYQSQSGTRPNSLAAGKIFYWPKTGHVKIDNLKPTEIHDVGQLRGRGAPAVKSR